MANHTYEKSKLHMKFGAIHPASEITLKKYITLQNRTNEKKNSFQFSVGNMGVQHDSTCGVLDAEGFERLIGGIGLVVNSNGQLNVFNKRLGLILHVS